MREAVPGCDVEVLPSDFKGGERDIATVLDAEPDVFAHNLETVRRLHGRIRPAFGYERSLEVLRIAKRLRPGQVTKSNLILGHGRDGPTRSPGACTDLARRRRRHRDDGPVPAADAVRICPSTAGSRRRSSPSTSAVGEALGIRTSRRDRWSGPATTPGKQLRRAVEAGRLARRA